MEQVAAEADKRERLQQLVLAVKRPSIVYFSSKRQTDLIAEWLRSTTHLRVAAYHAGLTSENRFKIQQQFMAGELDVICATSAFGMGIDKADIRQVIHYHLPTNLADYVQEIGRAGRDGQPALAVLLYAPGDEQLVRNLNNLTAASPAEIQLDQQRFQQSQVAETDLSLVLQYYWTHGYSVEQVTAQFESRQRTKEAELAQLLTYVQTKTCRRAVLMAYFNEPAPDHTPRCCQLSGEQLPLAQLGLTASTTRPQAATIPWQQILAQLFLQNS